MQKIFVFTIVFLLLSINISAQYADSLKMKIKPFVNCEVKMLEKSVKQIIKNNKIPNRTLGYSNYNEILDKIVIEISKIDCVVEATWDKCALKPAIYPGTSTIGVKYYVENILIEQCFYVSQDKMVYFRIFNWYRHLIKYKYELVYLGSSNCSGFFEREKENCERLK